MINKLNHRAILLCLCLAFFSKLSCGLTLNFNRSKEVLYIVSFNVLAPCWASAVYYPQSVAPYLAVEKRRKQTIHFLKTISGKADIIALQETTDIELSHYEQILKKKYYSFQAHHDKKYWADQISKDIPWTPNGVALFIKKSRFTQVKFQDVPLSNNGNHAAYFEGVLQTGEKLRAASIHLDSELDSNRINELSALMTLMPEFPDSLDIIAGDFNYGIKVGTIHDILIKNHFSDAIKKEEWTHPFYENGDANAGVIDHIVTRHLTPVEGKVMSYNLWKLYPQDEVKRIIANLSITGSDHFPVGATLLFSSPVREHH